MKYLIGGKFNFNDLIESKIKLIDKNNNEIEFNTIYPRISFSLQSDDNYMINGNIDFQILIEDAQKLIENIDY